MYEYKYPRPAVTADCIVFAKTDEGTKVLLVQRGNDPCKGMWAFPGGIWMRPQPRRHAVS